MKHLFTISLISIALFLFLSPSVAVDSIAANQVIKDGDTIVSAGEMYELGFFSPPNSNKRYLGIWYKKIATSTVVWVANRELPLSNTSGTFKVTNQGLLLLSCCGDTIIWSSTSSPFVRYFNPLAQLLDTGNFVVKDGNNTDDTNFIWQSFDYPGDTFLPGMKFGKDFVTGINRTLTSWNSPNDPSPGQYVEYMDTNGYPQIFMRQGSVLQLRFGPWNGIRFSGLPNEIPNSIYSTEYVFNQKEVYYKYELTSSVVQMIHLKWDGSIQVLNWSNRSQDWFVYGTGLVDTCGCYGICGPYGTCDIYKNPPCRCLDGFEPKRPDEWSMADWSSGCQLKIHLDCRATEVFRKIRESEDIFIRIPASLLKDQVLTVSQSGFNKKIRVLAITFSILLVLLGLSLAVYICNMKMKRSYTEGRGLRVHTFAKRSSDVEKDDLEGVLESGQEIAVKKLSETSEQGYNEFYNEVVCVARLQHRNLVELIGYCMDENERILIYEYMSNKSLDLYLFDETKSSMLNWPMRLNIIHGIAKGILYLHQDSRHRIIHRDIKASNILLDGDMNPKISDFGLAREFGGDQVTAKTKKVVGTYGYISPEYAIHGGISVKSDVFSFGILVLEIVSGKKNREFSCEDVNDNLLGHAWRLYAEGKCLELMSPSLHNSCIVTQR